MKARTELRVAAALLLVVVIAVGLFVLPAKDLLVSFLQRLESMGPWGPVLLAGVYVVACVLFVPGVILTLGAGFLFGVVTGTIAISCGSVLGATAAFLVGRTWLRDSIERQVAAYPRFHAIDRAVGEHGFKIVLLTRLSPLFPFNVLNYAFGLTNVRLWHYVLASWIGMFPATVMYVYLGSALKNMAEVATGTTSGGVLERMFFLAGLAMTVIATIVITVIARRALNQAVAEYQLPMENGARPGDALPPDPVDITSQAATK